MHHGIILGGIKIPTLINEGTDKSILTISQCQQIETSLCWFRGYYENIRHSHFRLLYR